MPEIELPPGMSPEDVQRILANAAKKKVEPTGNDYVEFASFESGNERQIRVYRDIYKGREMFSVRQFYLDEAEGWKPGKGVTFHDEDVDEIIAGLNKMNEWLTENRSGGYTQQGED
ncbi:MAG: transcriptional coactivator p15/PC4 family protein [Gammaproteobacteria bacterium]|nr:transcriptional coactivator p15/PC4 family protein [Gammaproteobacteria bacterium]